jgi:hypothetical protein
VISPKIRADINTTNRWRIRYLRATSTEYAGDSVELVKIIDPRNELIVTRSTSGRKKLFLTSLIGLFSS